MINMPAVSISNSVLPQIEQNRLNELKVQSKLTKNHTNDELMSLAHQFESIFIHQVLKSMRSTIPKSGLLESHATRMYESMHDQEMANLMSEKRSIGLAEMIYKDLVRLEKKSTQASPEDNKSF